jgi:hypothetical protein
MATAPFAFAGDDPSLSADVLPLTAPANNLDDPSLSPPLDPLTGSITDFGNAPVYGPTLAQLGATDATPGIAGASDPSAFNAHPSTASPPGKSPLDTVLGIGKLATGIFSAATSRGAAVANPTTTANKIGTAKNPVTGAGKSNSLLIFVILAFVGLMLFLEFKH